MEENGALGKKKKNKWIFRQSSESKSLRFWWLVRLLERENLKRFVCGVFRSRTFLSILPFRPLLKHILPPPHHPHFTNFVINGSHQGLSLLSLNIIFRLLLIFVIVVVVPHYVANRTQIDWRWVSFHATFAFLSQLTIFVFFLLFIQVKPLVNNSQPRLPGRLLRYACLSPSSPSSPTTT